VGKRLAAVVILVTLAACGGGGGGSPTAPATPPSTPAASIMASGEGTLVLHVSAVPAYAFALETPIRIRESGGGSADWNFARFSMLKDGTEVERGEIGSDVIRTAGNSPIRANSNTLYAVYFRFNSEDFDDVRITLGFGDLKDGRQFTVDVADNWTDLNISLTPAMRR
jgi:hypothetical protein